MAKTFRTEVEYANVSVAGMSFFVQEFRLSLSAGGIPQLILSVDPAARDRLSSELETKRTRAQIDEVVQLRDELEARLYQETAQRELDFEFRARSIDDPEPQVLDLRSWLLTGVGFVFDRQGATIGVQLEARHPAWKLTETPAQLDGLEIAAMKDHTNMTGKDLHALILAAMKKTYEVYTSEHTLTNSAQDAAEKHKRVDQESGYVRAIEAMEAHYRWDGRGAALGLPIKGIENHKVIVETGMYRYVSNLFATGAWDKFTTSLLADWYATLIPSFWESQLRITPFAPWAPPAIQVPITNFTRVESPPQSPVPVVAVSVMTSPYARTSFDLKDTRDKLVPSVADRILNQPGRSVMLSLPTWLSDLPQAWIAKNAGPETARGRLNRDVLRMPSNATTWDGSKLGTEDKSMWLDFLDATKDVFAPQLLLDHYRRQTGLSCSGRLMIKHKGASSDMDRHVVPGQVIYIGQDQNAEDPDPFKPPGGGNGLYVMYLTDVIHQVSRNSNTASTQIRGQYVRSPSPSPWGPTVQAIRGTLITEGVRRPLVYGG